ncbi:MAG TPA: DUF4410 domain-containing protein [Candidatus Acidoferrum sp.]|nr:DUF4410 domain-containing protein [Candidatus Acidoferrum sp.]
MRASPRAFLAMILLMSNWHGLEFAEASAAAKGPQTPTSPPKPTVYVSDFEIDVLPSPQSGAPKPEEDPGKQASRLVELMSTKLVAALQKAGYTAVRMHAGDARPDSGVQIRGLFAEVDNENHWRRAVIRTATDSGKMEALVAVANLAKPEQALYEIAHLPGNEPKPGAVITLSPYVPLTKFDLSKDANEDVFQKIAPRIVNDLTDLLNANPLAIPQ